MPEQGHLCVDGAPLASRAAGGRYEECGFLTRPADRDQEVHEFPLLESHDQLTQCRQRGPCSAFVWACFLSNDYLLSWQCDDLDAENHLFRAERLPEKVLEVLPNMMPDPKRISRYVVTKYQSRNHVAMASVVSWSSNDCLGPFSDTVQLRKTEE